MKIYEHYKIIELPEMIRGSHANRKSEFALINVAGSAKVKIDDRFSMAVIELNKPRMGIYIPSMLWKDMYDFSKDAVLLVLSNEHYDADEYIRDYKEYKEIVVKECTFIKRK